jgi:hypothetical protein
MNLRQQPGGAGQHAVHEPDRRGRAGQRLHQRRHPVRGQEVHHHQIHDEGLQIRAIPDRAGPSALRARRGMHRAAAALNSVLVVLDDRHGHLRDLVLLVAVDHTEIAGTGQVITALAAALREPVAVIIRGAGPGQTRPGCPTLLAPIPPRHATLALLLRRRGLPRVVITRRRARRVLRVPRQQVLELGQPARQRLVGLHQLCELPGHVADLPVLRGQLPGLTPHHNDQLVARHLLRLRHPKITSQTSRSPVTDTPLPPRSHRPRYEVALQIGLNAYRDRGRRGLPLDPPTSTDTTPRPHQPGWKPCATADGRP